MRGYLANVKIKGSKGDCCGTILDQNAGCYAEVDVSPRFCRNLFRDRVFRGGTHSNYRRI